jgi:hypothetical protein
MSATINHPATLLTAARADALAAHLNADADDEWTYTAIHDPKGDGFSFVEVTDENGVTLGRL